MDHKHQPKKKLNYSAMIKSQLLSGFVTELDLVCRTARSGLNEPSQIGNRDMRTLIALSMLAVSCGGYPTSYSLGINDFDDHHVALIRKAAQNWVNAIGSDRIHINVYANQSCVGANTDVINNNDGDTCILPVEDASHSFNYIVEQGGSKELGVCIREKTALENHPIFPAIYIETSKIGNDDQLFLHIVEHEMGHMFGLSHTNNEKDVMYTVATKVNVQYPISHNDVAQYDDLRGFSD
ncbi:MAG: matrixin family metalloprotease [Candidatus Micrarchaeota archaeon]|nr:matrixin family metalloprotease [Candidatus Micrarchaeota archaeon]